jgi:hypothetical protein
MNQPTLHNKSQSDAIPHSKMEGADFISIRFSKPKHVTPKNINTLPIYNVDGNKSRPDKAPGC